jgi:hypothetical protein
MASITEAAERADELDEARTATSWQWSSAQRSNFMAAAEVAPDAPAPPLPGA